MVHDVGLEVASHSIFLARVWPTKLGLHYVYRCLSGETRLGASVYGIALRAFRPIHPDRSGRALLVASETHHVWGQLVDDVLGCAVFQADMRHLWLAGATENAFLVQGGPCTERDAFVVMAHDLAHWVTMAMKHGAAGRAVAVPLLRARVRAMCRRSHAARVLVARSCGGRAWRLIFAMAGRRRTHRPA